MVRVQDTDGYEKAGTLVRSASSLLEETIRNLPEAAFAIDRDGRVMAWNRAIETMTGISAADMLGKGNYEYSVPFYRGRVPMLVDQAIGSGDLPVGVCLLHTGGRKLSHRRENRLPAKRVLAGDQGESLSGLR